MRFQMVKMSTSWNYEHIERAGVHSGDSMAVYPPQTLSKEVMDKLIDYTTRIARGLTIVGLLNIQFVVTKEEDVYVLEVNPTFISYGSILK